jgi:hypothetical protein
MSLYVPEINFILFCRFDQYEMHDNACVNYLPPPTILYTSLFQPYEEK